MGITAAVAAAIALPVAPALLLVLTPLVWLATLVPLTEGDVGVRELAFISLFGHAAVAHEAALVLVLALGTLAAMAVVGAVGALWMWRAPRP